MSDLIGGWLMGLATPFVIGGIIWVGIIVERKLYAMRMRRLWKSSEKRIKELKDK